MILTIIPRIIPLWKPPLIDLIITFEVSVTLEYSVVFNSRGIREAIQGKSKCLDVGPLSITECLDSYTLSINVEKNPLKGTSNK